MLTDRQIHNIQNFDKLTSNHRRVFRYFLRNKCDKVLKHLKFILLNYERLHMRPDDIVNLKDLKELVRIVSKINEKKFYRSLGAL